MTMRITHSFIQGQNILLLHRSFGFSWNNGGNKKLLELSNWGVCRSEHNIKPVQIRKF